MDVAILLLFVGSCYRKDMKKEVGGISVLSTSKGGFRGHALLALYSTRINCNLDRPKRD